MYFNEVNFVCNVAARHGHTRAWKKDTIVLVSDIKKGDRGQRSSVAKNHMRSSHFFVEAVLEMPGGWRWKCPKQALWRLTLLVEMSQI